MLKATSTVLLISVLAQGALGSADGGKRNRDGRRSPGGAHLHTRVITLSGLKPTEQEAAGRRRERVSPGGRRLPCPSIPSMPVVEPPSWAEKRGSDGADRIVSISGFYRKEDAGPLVDNTA